MARSFPRSAELQSAVSPICNRERVGGFEALEFVSGPKTVENHRLHIGTKLDIRGSNALLKCALADSMLRTRKPEMKQR
jgi:hypothetical protein